MIQSEPTDPETLARRVEMLAEWLVLHPRRNDELAESVRAELRDLRAALDRAATRRAAA